ncbi:hypothetical protein [Fodinibius salinus]|nr:hypothetical protein [Fodinibius salinus]
MKSILTTTSTLLLMALLFMGCKQSMVISKVDYSQSIESVLKPDEEGVVKDAKHGLSFNIKPLQYAETRDTSSVTTEQVRYIRGQKGFYYITAPNYKNVYVMEAQKGSLKLKKKLSVSEKGVSRPAFNQRGEYIQLVNLETDEHWKVQPESITQVQSQIAKNEGE